MSMYFSIYRIHTDKGTYVGHTRDFNFRMGWHYSCKFNDDKSNRHIIQAIRETPDDRLKVEEMGVYDVETRKDIELIERYLINTTKSNLNMILKDVGTTIYHNDVIDFVRCSEVTRGYDEKINTNMKYNFDVWCIIMKMRDLHL
jgi:hypothetical protein